mgnify:CR=1 FL=1
MTLGNKNSIQLTAIALDSRATNFRNLKIAILLVLFLSLTTALIQFSPLPLVGFFLLPPITSFFFVLDYQFVRKWQKEILNMWINGDLQLSVFYKSIQSMRMLPPKTIQSMIDTLPQRNHQEGELEQQNLSEATRRIIAKTTLTISRCESDRLIAIFLMTTFSTLAIILAILFTSWSVTTLILLIIPVFMISKWLRILRLKRLKNDISSFKNDNPNSFQAFIQNVKALDWSPISDEKKENYLSSIERM